MLTPSHRLFIAIKNNNWRAASAIIADESDISPASELSGEKLYLTVLERAPSEIATAFFRRFRSSIDLEVGHADTKKLFSEMGRLGRQDIVRILNDNQAKLQATQFAQDILNGAIEGRHIELVEAFSDKAFLRVNNKDENGITPILKSLEDDDLEWFNFLVEKGAYTSSNYGENEDETLFYRAVKNGAWSIAAHMASNPGLFNVRLPADKANELIGFTLSHLQPMRPTREQADIVASRIMADSAQAYQDKNVRITFGSALENSLQDGLSRTLQVGFSKKLFPAKQFDRDLLIAARAKHFNLENLKGVTNLYSEDWDGTGLKVIQSFFEQDSFASDEADTIIDSPFRLKDRMNAILDDMPNNRKPEIAVNSIFQKMSETIGSEDGFKTDTSLGRSGLHSYHDEVVWAFESLIKRYADKLESETLHHAMRIALINQSDIYKDLLALGVNPNHVSGISYLSLITLKLESGKPKITPEKWLEIYENLLAHDLDPQVLQENYNRFSELLLPVDSHGPLGIINNPKLTRRLLDDGFYIKGKLSPLNRFWVNVNPDEVNIGLQILQYQKDLDINNPEERKKADPDGLAHFIESLFESEKTNILGYRQLASDMVEFGITEQVGDNVPSAGLLAWRILDTFPAATMARQASTPREPGGRILERLISKDWRNSVSQNTIKAVIEAGLHYNKIFTHIDSGDSGESYTTPSLGAFLLKESLPEAGKVLIRDQEQDDYWNLHYIFKTNTRELCTNDRIHETGESMAHLTIRHGAEMVLSNARHLPVAALLEPDNNGNMPFDYLPDKGEDIGPNSHFWRITAPTDNRRGRLQRAIADMFKRCLKTALNNDSRDTILRHIDRTIEDEQIRANLLKDTLKQGSPIKARRRIPI